MNDNHQIPQFETEAEEAQWWFDHREDTADWMERAAAEGRTTSLAEIRRGRSETVAASGASIRIDPADLSRAKSLAERRGLGYEAYLKMLVHEALEREDPSSAG